MNLLSQEWQTACPELYKEFLTNIAPKLLETDFYPETNNIFRALNECNPDSVKVVLLGQD